jgi:tRNA-specific 2-thiouridylase
MRTPEGVHVGEHMGLAFYTIGQRQGLGIGGMRNPPAPGAPWYVAGKDRERNELVVVQGHEHPLLRSRALTAADLAWVSGEPPAPEGAYGGKTRYRQADAACRIAALDYAECRVEFDDPQWAVTPGQSVVLYQGEVCLGGGVIR